MPDDSFWRHFYEIYEALPRQGPGTCEATRRALGHVPPLGAGARILDVGCGSGAQTLDLAAATRARIVAVDRHAPFLARLAGQVAEAGLGARVAIQVADMARLPFPDRSFDVIWSEGAIFVIGFSEGLAAWRRLLKPGGHVVVSEFCWFCDDPPEELRRMHIDGYPEAGTLAARRAAVATTPYEPVADFVLPGDGWWENYYVPLGGQLARFRAAHAGDAEALEVADRCQQEIDLYRRYSDLFGYAFFVLRLPEGR